MDNYPDGVNGSHPYFNPPEPPECEECGAEIEYDEWKYCPFCGTKIRWNEGDYYDD